MRRGLWTKFAVLAALLSGSLLLCASWCSLGATVAFTPLRCGRDSAVPLLACGRQREQRDAALRLMVEVWRPCSRRSSLPGARVEGGNACKYQQLNSSTVAGRNTIHRKRSAPERFLLPGLSELLFSKTIHRTTVKLQI